MGEIWLSELEKDDGSRIESIEKGVKDGRYGIDHARGRGDEMMPLGSSIG